MQDKRAEQHFAARVARAVLFAEAGLQCFLLRFQLREALFDCPSCHDALDDDDRRLRVLGVHLRFSASTLHSAMRLIWDYQAAEKYADVPNCICCLATSRIGISIVLCVAAEHFSAAIFDAALS
jgi:hypothetical protein